MQDYSISVNLFHLLVAFAVAMGIPSAITGFCFSRFQKKIDERDREREQKEKLKEDNELLLIRLAGASLSLGEATAEAVQRIPDAHCNGDMHAALEYAKQVKHEHKDMLYEQAVRAII